MPRPERIRNREQALADGVDAEPVGELEPPPSAPLNRKEEVGIRRTLRATPVVAEEEPLDNPPELEQFVRQGPVVAEVDPELELSRKLARPFGWVPKEEWTRDPEKWTEATDFLADTPRQMAALKERLKRFGQVAEDQAEQARRDGLAQARAELEAATREGNVERAGEAADRIAKNSGPPPQTTAWIARNPWFRSDPDAQTIAANAMRKAERIGATIEEQLQAGEAEARRRFPEHFDIAPAPRLAPEPQPQPTPEPAPVRQEARFSEVRTPPQMARGSRGGGPSVPKEKGWMDIPAADRSQMTRFVKSAVRKGLTEAEATRRLAYNYWDTKA